MVRYKKDQGDGRVSLQLADVPGLPLSFIHVLIWDPKFKELLLYKIPPSAYHGQLVAYQDRFKIKMSLPDWQLTFSEHQRNTIEAWAK
jgi:hypothetical protein